MKKKKLTIEEHKEIGKHLKEIREYLINLSCTVPNTYGKTSSAGKLACKLFENVDALRSVMENQCFRDCPGEADTDVYYPANK